MRLQLLLAVREMMKDAVSADPDMPRCAGEHARSVVDNLWTDLIVYEERLVPRGPNMPDEHDLYEAHGQPPRRFSPFWFRASILYCWSPFDRSSWRSLRSPLSWLMSAASLLPFFGLRIWLFLLLWLFILRGCPPDEYQLVRFFLGVKTTQFIGGLAMSVVAATMYYSCVYDKNFHRCDVEGPGSMQDLASSAVDFVGNALLVWLAFVSLPCSSPAAGQRDLDSHVEDGSELGSETEGSDGSHGGGRQKGFCSCCRRRRCHAAGRLVALAVYDLACFFATCCLLVRMADIDRNAHHTVHHGSDAVTFGRASTNMTSAIGVGQVLMDDVQHLQFRNTLLLVRIVYALLALPIVVFQLPVLTHVLTHTAPTGYNLQGMCVPHVMPLPAKWQ